MDSGPIRHLEDHEAAEVDSLLAEYQMTGDKCLRDRAVQIAMPLADCLARRYARKGADPDDLRQVALLGLVRAADRFDAAFPNGFVPFAVVTIVGELRRYFRDRTWALRVPRAIKEKSLAVRAAMERLSSQGVASTVHAVAEEAGVSIDDALEGIEGYEARSIDSLDAPIGMSATSTVGDTVGHDDRDIDKAVDLAALQHCLRKLNAEERRLIDLRFGADMTQSQIGETLGCSQMHVSRQLARLQRKLHLQLTLPG
jgi:RNA polymerase sigma-B factor